MRKQRADQIRALVRNQDPDILMAVRNKFGTATQTMDDHGIYKAAKKLYLEGKLTLPNIGTKKRVAKHENQSKSEEN